MRIVDRAIGAGIACALIALAAGPAAAQSDLDAKMKQLQAASADAAKVMVQIKDANSASQLSSQLSSVMASYQSAQDALQAAIKKADTDPSAKVMKEKAQATMTKAEATVGKERKRLLASKETGPVVRKHFEKKQKPSQDKSTEH